MDETEAQALLRKLINLNSGEEGDDGWETRETKAFAESQEKFRPLEKPVILSQLHVEYPIPQSPSRPRAPRAVSLVSAGADLGRRCRAVSARRCGPVHSGCRRCGATAAAGTRTRSRQWQCSG